MEPVIHFFFLTVLMPWSGAEDSLNIPNVASDIELEAFNITLKNFTVELNNHKLAAQVSSATPREDPGSVNESVFESFPRQPLHGEVDKQKWGGSLLTRARGSLSSYRPEFSNINPFDFSSRYTRNMIRVNYITADCYDNYMRINLHFNGTFSGIVYSTGYVHDPDCVYINGSYDKRYEFYIRLNRCGTLGQRNGDYNTYFLENKKHSNEYMWNTITVQYNSVIEEEWDENFRVTCEYGYDYRKTVTFPLVNVEANTGNPVVFTLTPPVCYMEIKEGFNVRGHPINKPVSVGDPLTLIVQMKSENKGFDILVSNCLAHNGAQKRLQLIDSNGCVTNKKLITPFRGHVTENSGQDVTLFAYLKAFRFTGSLALYLECDIHMCHGACPSQRCYWRTLKKRSADILKPKPTTLPVLETISLFQALEVQQEKSRVGSRDRENKGGYKDGRVICLQKIGFAALLSGLMFAFMLTSGLTIFLCLRLRRVKNSIEKQPIKMKDPCLHRLQKLDK